MKKAKLAWQLFICFAPKLLLSQHALNTTGNTLRSDSVSYAFSVGEVTGFSTNRNCLFTSGVIQPAINVFSRSVVGVFSQLHGILFYPNPTHDIVIIETSYPNLSSYQINSIDGKTLETGKFRYAPIHLGRLQAGLYLITLFSADYKIRQTFKIIRQ